MRDTYYRPIVQTGPARPAGAMRLAGGWCWFNHIEVLGRGRIPSIIPLANAPDDILDAIHAPRADVGALSMDRPRVMGILNATPDSFSDGGLHAAASDAVAAGVAMRDAGVDILDIGGESTRPGAQTVPVPEETNRVVPVIAGLRDAGVDTLVSVDTRKAEVARAALNAAESKGAGLINDVSGFTYDAALAPLAAEAQVPVCVMHAMGDPATMQQDPQYDDVLLDVYDFLETQIDALTRAGVARSRIIADPGIGFGKTLQHNLTLLSRLSLFHSLGVPVLLGASRKRFIGTIGGEEQAKARAPGSIGVGLAALSHGIQILRVHDVPETIQAIALWRAAMAGRQI
ncbi:Dihydropteroate synthase, DHPS [Sulfitobacter noctilucicola]|uniref:Dihydropteroate synthase n=1 Tax=Sulfitobacter noctilucicola TaxID=1342301 RepID=A0A7W6M8D3_9RHOB|nr:dihydropteroate synthase [Sulfitobacter noctilucicola]KIN64546.1 Dihydropteroate synthase, DHPS [Sulfitobacter noctilucicola]MBB4174299.1 dihydropteroate synthase [Sulfitobacter noctilucicola]